MCFVKQWPNDSSFKCRWDMTSLEEGVYHLGNEGADGRKIGLYQGCGDGVQCTMDAFIILTMASTSRCVTGEKKAKGSGRSRKYAPEI